MRIIGFSSKAGALFALLTVVLACGPKPVDIGHQSRSYEPSDYRDIFECWSREIRILPVDGVENVLTARATYLSYEFRSAYVVRVASDLRYTPAEKQQLLARELDAEKGKHEFFVSLMSGLDNCDELDTDEGPWRIRLVDDRGRGVVPEAVVEVRKPTAAEIKYFDFDPVQRKAYRLSFPVLADDGQPIISSRTRSFSLTFSSAFSQGDMEWEIDSGAGQ